MYKLKILVVVAAVFVEGYSAASLAAGPDNGEQVAKIVKREASSPFGNGFPFNNAFMNPLQAAFAHADGQKSGNGHYYSSSFVSHAGVDANGNPISSGVEVTDNDGKTSLKHF